MTCNLNFKFLYCRICKSIYHHLYKHLRFLSGIGNIEKVSTQIKESFLPHFQTKKVMLVLANDKKRLMDLNHKKYSHNKKTFLNILDTFNIRS